MRNYKKKSIVERIMSKVDKTDSCWLWKDATEKSKAPRISTTDGTIYVRQYMCGSIGVEVTGNYAHVCCRNPKCVNPRHVYFSNKPVEHIPATHEEGISNFWARVKKSEGCWHWTAGMQGQGYGDFSYMGEKILAHRFSLMMFGGGLPKGQYACHHCDNPICVRPDHLFAGTAKDNNDDRERKMRGQWSGNTTCSKGHELTKGNTYIYGRNRACKICALARAKARYALIKTARRNTEVAE